MKETLINLATGLIAKLIRYALTGIGGVNIAASTPDGKPIDIEHLAGGIGAVVVALIWSVWEDRVKKRKALETPIAEVTVPTIKPHAE